MKDQLTIIAVLRSGADPEHGTGVRARGHRCSQIPSLHHPYILLASRAASLANGACSAARWPEQLTGAVKWGDRAGEWGVARDTSQELSTRHGKQCPRAKRNLLPAGLHRDRTWAEIPARAPVLGAGGAVAARGDPGACSTSSSLCTTTGARNRQIHMKAAGSSAALEPVFRITTVCRVVTQKWDTEEKWHICY